jgi:hypothetical protein
VHSGATGKPGQSCALTSGTKLRDAREVLGRD